MMDKSVISNKSSRMAAYREHLDKMIILLTDKYQLPEISGAVKQIAWATDIRIKFVEVLDKHSRDISSEVLSAVNAHILNQTESRWWIDRKDTSFEEHLQYAKTLCSITEFQDSKNVRCEASNVAVIDCQDDEVIIVTAPEATAPILQKYLFEEAGGCWSRKLSVDENEREGVINALCLALLRAGHTARILPHTEPPVIHDGLLTVVDGKLCVIARTEAVFKAASRIGKRHVFLDGCKKSDVLEFVQNYDVEMCADAQGVLGL